MEITVKRRGGFAGLTEDIAAINTARLETPVAQRVEHMLQSSGFFDLPATVFGGTVGADLRVYEITVTAGNGQHTVMFPADESNPTTASLHQLVQTLRQIAEQGN